MYSKEYEELIQATGKLRSIIYNENIPDNEKVSWYTVGDFRKLQYHIANIQLNDAVVKMLESGDMVLEFLADREFNEFQVKHTPTGFHRRYGEFAIAKKVYEECVYGITRHDPAWTHLFPVYIKEDE